MKWKNSLTALALVTSVFSVQSPLSTHVEAAAGAVEGPVISEIAWMGTTVDANDEWIELYNPTSQAISLNGWTLKAQDGTPSIPLQGSINPGDTFLLERTDDSTVPGIAADQLYSGALSNSGEVLELVNAANQASDSISKWYAGDSTSRATMERKNTLTAGDDPQNWKTASTSYDAGFGTPGTVSGTSNGQPEQLNNVSNDVGAINVYFNKTALSQFATPGNVANYNVNLENRLLNRINAATKSIDIATYEINLPNIVDALIEKASTGVTVRMIADAKPLSDPEHDARYELMKLYLEKLARGKDGQVNTSDDVHIFSDSIIFAVENQTKRAEYNLPQTGYQDFTQRTVTVGSGPQTGHMLVEGESKSTDAYYSPDDQMHNKFLIIDGKWVFTGSWNFTTTGLYGTDENRANGILDGNSNHSIELHSSELSTIYKTEFDEMWGSASITPNANVSNYGSRKTDNTAHQVTVGGKMIQVYFSPGDNAVPKMNETIETSADQNTYFSIFAWSDQSLVDTLKMKWEGSRNDMEGTLTGFDVKGVFDDSFWNMWWSASVDMTGRTATQTSVNNPNTRWKNPAPVYMDKESRKLHHKYFIIDADTSSDPLVITGSTNWSTNGNDVNDENALWIHDLSITNQFKQEFMARYQQAGGNIQ
ncbi:lamin tail domain-containing protein [Fictibacillus nanhaiensis]|uniref:phospholipase D-like domain-containing protein n=1 Tax=Fictibacillus nanhaiensis TaxID=742169 RepID=UPI001C9547BC|nr:phospholipase D-like domain-containing protein [Fictibacillus nanhaiensis]MBY6035874.1 lamin tail domain-containing protein [Fictibacillus nanhaiensis]